MNKYVTKTSASVKNRYLIKTYDRITLTVKKGQKPIIASHAKMLGRSLNSYVVDLIEKDMNSKNDSDL